MRVGTVFELGWVPALRFPGLHGSERVVVRLSAVARGEILAADGEQLSPDSAGRYPMGAGGEAIAGALGQADIAERAQGEIIVGLSGLERLYNARLAGRAGAELIEGRQVIGRSTPRPGVTVRTTIDPMLERAAVAQLGARNGGIAVIQPSSGAVLALAGIALSSAQPPGSTFKIITTTALLDAGLVTSQSTFPVQTEADLDGYILHNADGEACGGTLTEAFAASCNSVFAPLGERLGAALLVAEARAFGFDDPVRRLPDEAQSSIPAADQIGAGAAVGSSAIGQGRVLATPLEMATVAATIADDGVRARPRLLASLPLSLRRVTSSRIAAEVRELMLAVVREGTATAVQIPGVPIAAKTGTAELRNDVTTPDGVSPPANPQNDDAWLVAFPAIAQPDVAVAVNTRRRGGRRDERGPDRAGDPRARSLRSGQMSAARPTMTIASIPSPPSSSFHRGGLSFHDYGLCDVLGIAAAIVCTRRLWARRGGDPGLVYEIALWGVPAGILGGRLYHDVTSWNTVPHNWWGWLAVWQGGLGIWGGIAGGFIGALVPIRRRHIDLAAFMDVVAPGLLIAQAIGRVGNYFNQELFGGPTNLPWALQISSAHRPARYLTDPTFQPTFLYELIFDLLLSGVLVALLHKERIRAPGIFALYVTGYSAFRIFEELLRVDPAHYILGERLNFWVASLVALIAAGWLAAIQRRREPGSTNAALAKLPVGRE